MSRTATFEMIDGGGSSGDHHQSRRIHHFQMNCPDMADKISSLAKRCHTLHALYFVLTRMFGLLMIIK